MNKQDYLKLVRELYLANFNMEKNKEIAGYSFPLYAFCEVKNEKFVAHRSIKIYSYSDYEHCLVDLRQDFTEENLHRDFFSSCCQELVEIDEHHHQTYLTYVMAVEKELTPEEIKKIKQTKFSKSYWLGFRGWCDLRLIVVDLATGEVYCNKKGKEVAGKYNPDWLEEKVTELYE